MDFADCCWDVASCCRSRGDATARRLPHRSEPTLKEGNAGGGFRLRPFSLPAGEWTFGFLAGWISRLLRIGGWTLGGEDPSVIRARVEAVVHLPRKASPQKEEENRFTGERPLDHM